MKVSKKFSMDNLLVLVRTTFDKIHEPRGTKVKYSLTDCLMSGLAIFSLKCPSLLQYDKAKSKPLMEHNLRTLFGVQQSPSDTTVRERLDDVDPQYLRKAFKKLFAHLQRGKHLEKFAYIDGKYLISIDGTGYHSSDKVHCNSCCERKHRNGKVTYYHNMLAASLVHPGYKEVIPFAPEPITKQDGASKNDCEQNAAKRILQDMRREHPHLKVIIIEDALHANSPHVAAIKEHNMSFIIGAKQYEKDFDFFDEKDIKTHKHIDEDGTEHSYRFMNDIGLNSTDLNLKVNFLDYTSVSAKGKKHHFTWITDLKLTETSVHKIMQGGRARWKIENETFNTLKNQGYHFEHNYGHGYNHLSTVFANLMLLAFLIDQVQQLCCSLFNDAWDKVQSKKALWHHIKAYFTVYRIKAWETVYMAIITEKGAVLELDTT